MRLDVRIYRVKANSQAGNIRVYMMTKQKGESREIVSKGSRILPDYLAGGLGSRRERCWG